MIKQNSAEESSIPTQKPAIKLQKVLKLFQKLLTNLKIIDTKKLLKDSEKKHKDQNFCIKNEKNPKAFDALFCNIFSPLEKSEGLKSFYQSNL